MSVNSCEYLDTLEMISPVWEIFVVMLVLVNSLRSLVCFRYINQFPECLNLINALMVLNVLSAVEQ